MADPSPEPPSPSLNRALTSTEPSTAEPSPTRESPDSLRESESTQETPEVRSNSIASDVHADERVVVDAAVATPASTGEPNDQGNNPTILQLHN